MDAAVALLNRNEDLIPELKAHFHNKTFPMLQHPLVYSIPHFSEMNAYVNEQWRQKTVMLSKAVDEKKWESYIFIHERPYRMTAFCNIVKYLRDDEYWSLLKTVWVDSENIWQYKQVWIDFLTSTRKGFSRNFMNMTERGFLASLPDKVTIFRGYDESREGAADGLSYTLDHKIATKFSYRRCKKPALKTLIVDKEQILAFINQRGEEEIILRP